MDIRLSAPPQMQLEFDALFEDHAKLSDFIFRRSNVLVTLAELQAQTKAGYTGANDAPVLWLRRFITAMQDELRELSESLPWKWWRHEQADIQNVHVELVDLLHFIISAAQVAGLSGSQFLELYYKKRKINFDRQINGFDPNDNKQLVTPGFCTHPVKKIVGTDPPTLLCNDCNVEVQP